MKLGFWSLLIGLVVFVSCTSNIKQKSVADKTSENQEYSGGKAVKALEVIQGSQYTYVRADENGTEKWFAILKANIQVGQTYHYSEAMEMVDFTSKELNKTFDKIYFLNQLMGDQSIEEIHHPKAVAPAEDINIEIVDGQVSLVDLFTKRDEFNGKKVTVTGKVVKVNNDILHKNWIHIQDGSKQSENVNYDLTVTTTESIELNSVVVFEGILSLNRDFGAGYKYDLILEEAILK